MSTDAYILIDCGTSGVKATTLLKENSHFELLPSRKKTLIQTVQSSDQARTWDPGGLLRDVTSATLLEAVRAASRGATPKAIAITTTTSSLVTLRDGGIADDVTPLRWDDRQSSNQAFRLEEIRKKSSGAPWFQPVTSDSGLAKAHFLAETKRCELSDPETVVLEQSSFLNWAFTNRYSQAESILARKWGYSEHEPSAVRFLARAAECVVPLFGSNAGASEGNGSLELFLDKFLRGPVLPAGEAIGPLRRQLAESLGIIEPVVVASAPFDTACQVIGMNPFKKSLPICVSFGTSLGVCSVEPSGQAESALAIPNVPIRGYSMLFEGIASCGSAILYFCKQWGIMDGAHPDYAAMSTFLRSTPPGANGVTVVPFVNGGVRGAQAEGALGEVRGMSEHNGAPEVIRALLESLCYYVRILVERIEKRREKSTPDIHVGGGPVGNGAFMQLLADITGKNVVVPWYSDTSFVGAGACALVSAGACKDVPSGVRQIVGKRTNKFRPNSDRNGRYNTLFDEYRAAVHCSD